MVTTCWPGSSAIVTSAGVVNDGASLSGFTVIVSVRVAVLSVAWPSSAVTVIVAEPFASASVV